MIIGKAAPEQYPAVRAFYHSLIDAIASAPYGAGWKKDVYPAPEELMRSIASGELYIGTEGEAILAAMILNHACNEGYRTVQWPTGAEPDEVTVIHALGVHPAYGRKGHAKELVRFAIACARRDRQKAVRLDVLKGNLPAEKLYAGMGFRYLRTLPMYYEDTGWTDYALYEYPCGSVRSAAPDDAERLRGIYAYYVENTAVSFEYDVPSPEEFRSRIESTLQKYPYLVYEADGVILGYAYAGVFKARAAYDHSCEVSIYVDHAARGQGCGRALYEALEEKLKAQGILNLYACIAVPVREDEYLTGDSERFHRRLGYRRVGVFHKCGRKFGRWYNMIWMEKMLGAHR